MPAIDYDQLLVDINRARDQYVYADAGSPDERAAVERLHKLTGDYLAAHGYGAATGHDAALRAAERAYLHARARFDSSGNVPGAESLAAARDLVALLDADTAGDPVT